MTLIKTALAAMLFAFASNSAHATVFQIDPTTGLNDSKFSWENAPGPISDSWEINLLDASFIDISVRDDFIVGDEFELVVNGATTAWTSISTDTSGYFQGLYDDLLLNAGLNTITLNVVEIAPSYDSGSAFASFSPVSAVPEPSTYALMLGGIGFIGFMAARRRKNI